MHGELVPRGWLAGDALVAARRLLGCVLVHGEVALRVVEVEAYRWPGDSACHARAGLTPRTAPLWGPAGHAYVYLCYGLHHLLNVTAGIAGQAAGVLIRGAEVLSGAEVVAGRRGGRLGRGALAGPGKGAAGLGLTVAWSGHPLLERGGLELRVGERPSRVVAGPRIGIDYAEPEHRALPWRMAVADSDQVARPRELTRDGDDVVAPDVG